MTSTDGRVFQLGSGIIIENYEFFSKARQIWDTFSLLDNPSANIRVDNLNSYISYDDKYATRAACKLAGYLGGFTKDDIPPGNVVLRNSKGKQVN